MKKIIVISIFSLMLAAPFAVKAAFTASVSQNNMKVEGDCSTNVLVTLAKTDNLQKVVYSSGTQCVDGKFLFSDNLSQWQSLPDGEYVLVVNGDKQNTKNITIERSAEKATAAPAENTSTDSSGIESFANPKSKFFRAFVAFQQSILDMQTWLSETNYPTLAKEGIGMALDRLDMAVSKLSGLVLDSESAAIANSATENSHNSDFSADQSVPLSSDTVPSLNAP